jgi:hypothetical protein
MTDDKKALADQPADFRVGSARQQNRSREGGVSGGRRLSHTFARIGRPCGRDGVVEALTAREVDVLIALVIREAIEAGLSVRPGAALRATTR